MAAFNWVDYVIFGIFFLSILAGFSRGLIREVLSVLVWVLAYIIASKFAVSLAGVFAGLSKVGGGGSISAFTVSASFIALFIGVLIVGGIINYFIGTIISSVGLGFINRLLGGAFGFIRGVLIVVLLLFIFQLTSIDEGGALQNSKLTPKFQPWVLKLDRFISPHYEELKAKVAGAWSSAEGLITDALD